MSCRFGRTYLLTSEMMIDESTFRQVADGALDSLFKALTRASDSFDFEADMNNGALTVEFDDPPAKFVVSPNAPVRPSKLYSARVSITRNQSMRSSCPESTIPGGP